MGTQERKQRERMRREQQILQVARKMMKKDGYLGLNMDRIADEIEYSKGIVYLHFGSKEDIICALVAELQEELSAYFERAAQIAGTPRERMTALIVAAELFSALHPDYFGMRQVLWVKSIGGKVSDARRERLREAEAKTLGLLVGVVQEAMAKGDLQFALPESGTRVAFGVWTMLVGAETVIGDDGVREVFADVSLNLGLRENCQTLLDGFGWKPLSKDKDYEGTVRRVLQEAFADEAKRAKLGV